MLLLHRSVNHRYSRPLTLTRRFVLATAGAALAGCLAGCQWFAAPFLLWGEEPTRTVPAEYPYLTGKKVAILVWADSDTLFEYPQVQLEVSEHVAAALDSADELATKKGARLAIVPNRQVTAYQRSEVNWDREHPAKIGKQFSADRVLMIELTQYTTREPESTHLYRGRIAGNIKVYDPAYPDSRPAYKTTVEVAYPPESQGEWGTDDRAIRKSTMELFGSQVATKFFEHQEKIR